MKLWKTLGITLLLSVLGIRGFEVESDVQGCPQECECRTTSEGKGSTALCVFRNETIQGLFDVPHDIESLTILQANEDQDLFLDRDLILGFQRLRSVDLQGSLHGGRISISNDLFADFEDLKHLSLQRVDLAHAHKAFAGLVSLEVLYVIHCDIGHLKWEMLADLKNLQELYLLQSGIKELHGFAFYGTPGLRKLHLSHNDLFSVEADALVGLLRLEHLDLSHNRIDRLSFPPLPHLQWLELKHNPIKVIFPHCFQYLNGTQHLTLGHRQQPVHLMRFSFRGLYSLRYLHVPNIDNDVLFEHIFYDLRSLIHLRLRGRTRLINNRAFYGAHKLLTRLILRDCLIERLFEDSFHGLESLRALDLSGNRLRSLPRGVFRHLRAARHVRLDGNRLHRADPDLFAPLSASLRSLGLRGNPWNCSCGAAGVGGDASRWDARVVLAEYDHGEVHGAACEDKLKSNELTEVHGEMCNEEENGTADLEEEVESLEPKCRYPIEYEGESVFRVVQLLKCGN